MSRLKTILATVAACALCSCAKAPSPSPLAKREFQQFQREVYPVLLRDCAFPTCHGSSQRFFRVWGPGRSRLRTNSGMPASLDLPTGDEIATTYSLALSMIDDASPAHSMLLQKPLAIAAGGSGHRGVDKYGRDVYRTAEDSGYIALARWVFGSRAGATP